LVKLFVKAIHIQMSLYLLKFMQQSLLSGKDLWKY